VLNKTPFDFVPYSDKGCIEFLSLNLAHHAPHQTNEDRPRELCVWKVAMHTGNSLNIRRTMMPFVPRTGSPYSTLVLAV
jgi:hypothetical protein